MAHDCIRLRLPSGTLYYWFVREYLAEGRLVRVLEDWTPPFPGLRLYYPGHRHIPAGLRAFIDLVREVTSASKGNDRA